MACEGCARRRAAMSQWLELSRERSRAAINRIRGIVEPSTSVDTAADPEYTAADEADGSVESSGGGESGHPVDAGGGFGLGYGSESVE